MEKKLEWTQHKAPPVPILAGSEIVPDSLYLYGVDFMSTDNVREYFSRYFRDSEMTVEEQNKAVIWINDSSCVIKLPSAERATKAYLELKLSEPRMDEALPPLEDHLIQLREL